MFNNKHPKTKNAYAVVTGDYCGEMLIFIEKQKSNYCFLSIPKNVNRVVPIDKFEFGLQEGIVEHVQPIDSGVYNLLKKQYIYNLTHK